MDNEQQLREMSIEIESLTTELAVLRNKFQVRFGGSEYRIGPGSCFFSLNFGCPRSWSSFAAVESELSFLLHSLEKEGIVRMSEVERNVPSCLNFAWPGNQLWLLMRCCPMQEQQMESAKLRARVAQAASERNNLASEVKACDSSLNAQTVRLPYGLPHTDGSCGIKVAHLVVEIFRHVTP